jgi:hypothetical protein
MVTHQTESIGRSDTPAAREFAEVVLGGWTIGFASVETDPRNGMIDLSSLVLFRLPSASVPGAEEAPQCGCRTEDLAFARVRSAGDSDRTLGVKVCVVHRRLRVV